MNWVVIGLDLVTIFSVVILIAIAPYIKKVTNNYFFWASLGCVLLSYMLIFRFYGQFTDFWSAPKPIKNDDILVSRGLLLDICPFCAFTISLAIIIDPTRKFAKIIAPFALFGGLITILGGISSELQQNDGTIWHYIFIGDTSNPMYFMMHYINVFIGIAVLVSTPKMRLADWIYCNLFAGCYYLYVAICMISFHLTMNVSGLSLYDWSYGEYAPVAQIFHTSPAGAAALGFILSYTIISGFIFAQNRLQLLKRYRWYDMWNKSAWYIGWYQLVPHQIHESKSWLYKLCHLIYRKN